MASGFNFMLICDILSGSISGIVNEVFTMISSVIGIYVNDRTNRIILKRGKDRESEGK